jgi:hypothetical protein
LNKDLSIDLINWREVDTTFRASSVLPVLNPLHPLSTTTDLWRGKDRETYICLTGHYFGTDWTFRGILLDIYLCTDRHFGENLCEWIKQVLNDNCISVCIFVVAPPFIVISPRFIL